MSTELKMPFGKFKGVPLGEIETSYLKWLSTIELREPLKGAVAAALAWKAGSTPTARTAQEGAFTVSPGHSQGGSGASPPREAARPKRPFTPRQEDLSAYYTAQGPDDIPW
jgi:hypothetical protein